MTHMDAGEATALSLQEMGMGRELLPETHALFYPMVRGAMTARDGLKNCHIELWTKTGERMWPSCCDGPEPTQSGTCKQQTGNRLALFPLSNVLFH